MVLLESSIYLTSEKPVYLTDLGLFRQFLHITIRLYNYLIPGQVLVIKFIAILLP